jgi:RNA polymerase sigma-70 factor (ECF subfamily)
MLYAMSQDADTYLPTRRSLLSRLKSWDDQSSWQDFFDTYWKLIYNAARKAGLSHQEAEEVVQETVITVTKKIGDLKYDPVLGSFKGWLLHTTRWKINDQFRKRQRPGSAMRDVPDAGREMATNNPVEQVADPASFNLDAVWEEQWRANILGVALDRIKDKISPKQYQIFDLLVVKEWPVAQVTRTLHVTAAHVYLVKHWLTKLLKNEIKQIEKRLF